MRIQFNTNRQYSPEGQPIVAQWNGEYVMFADLARSMHGHFRWDGGIADASAMQNAIMNNYDAGIYEHTAKTYAFFQFEKKVWNDLQKEKTRSKAGKSLLELIEKLSYKIDEARAEFDEIGNNFQMSEGPEMDLSKADDESELDLFEKAYEISSQAERLFDEIEEYKNLVKEVTK